MHAYRCIKIKYARGKRAEHEETVVSFVKYADL